VVDGNDVLAVVEAVGRAARARAERRRSDPARVQDLPHARARGGLGHGLRPKHLFEEWGRKDPVARFEQWLFTRGLLDEPTRDKLRADLKPVIDVLVDEALAAPDPVSSAESELADVYAPSALSVEGRIRPRRRPEKRYIDAIQDGLREAMRRRREIVLMGQDIAEYGGVFKVTEGFVEEFGKARVRNTPIIESGAVGAALGLALDGFRPMIEMQFGDFITCGFNQIVNNLAKTHYRWGAAVPVVVRVPVGGGTGAGPFHSQNVEAWFTHVAGLKVIAPAHSVRCEGTPDRGFRGRQPRPLPRAQAPVPLRPRAGPVRLVHPAPGPGAGGARRDGRDHRDLLGRSVVGARGRGAIGRGRPRVEVIDLRTLLPWDRETVLLSVRKTGRALVLHEAPATGGFGGELAAVIGSEAFEALDAPVSRLGALDTPVPFSKALEEVFSPRARLLPALRALLAY
jgi:2-oxoisovalerate dehydrogenase E1 component